MTYIMLEFHVLKILLAHLWSKQTNVGIMVHTEKAEAWHIIIAKLLNNCVC